MGPSEVGLWDLVDCTCHLVLRTLTQQESEEGTAELPACLHASPSQGPLPPGAAAAAAPGGGPGARSVDPTLFPDELSSQLATDQINSPQSRLCGCRALLPLPGGQLLTGGSDRCVRCWEGAWPERSCVVCGPVWPEAVAMIDPATNLLQLPQHAYRYETRFFNDVPVVEEVVVGGSPRRVRPDAAPGLGASLRCEDLAHADCVTALALAAPGGAGGRRLLLSASRDGVIKAWK